MSVIYTSSSAVFECKSKACAPPPIGTGGSTDGGGSAAPAPGSRGSAGRVGREAALSIKNGSVHADGKRVTTKITKLGGTWHAKMLGKDGASVSGRSRMEVARKAAEISRHNPSVRPPSTQALARGKRAASTGGWSPPSPKKLARLMNRDDDPADGPRPPEAAIRKTWSALRNAHLKNPNAENRGFYEISTSYKGPKKFENLPNHKLYDLGPLGIAEANRRDHLERALGVSIWPNY